MRVLVHLLFFFTHYRVVVVLVRASLLFVTVVHFFVFVIFDLLCSLALAVVTIFSDFSVTFWVFSQAGSRLGWAWLRQSA